MPSFIKTADERPGKKYNHPISPWQKLIYGRMTELDISGRQVAAQTGIHHSTLWQWVHTSNGYPARGKLTREKALALYKCLHINPAEADLLLDQSRRIYSGSESPTALATRNLFDVFIDLLETRVTNSEDRFKRLKRPSLHWILETAKALRAGLPVPPCPQDEEDSVDHAEALPKPSKKAAQPKANGRQPLQESKKKTQTKTK